MSSSILGPSCPDGSNWFSCGYGSFFVGCCTFSNACDENVGCPAANLENASFENYYPGPDDSPIPIQICPSSAPWYTCDQTEPKFMGCCKLDPCKNGKCPAGYLIAASLNRTDNAAFSPTLSSALSTVTLSTSSTTTVRGSLSTQTSSPSSLTSGTSSSSMVSTSMSSATSTISASSAATTSPSSPALPQASPSTANAAPAGAIAGGVVGGLVAIVVVIALFLYHRRHTRSSRDSKIDEIQQSQTHRESRPFLPRTGTPFNGTQEVSLVKDAPKTPKTPYRPYHPATLKLTPTFSPPGSPPPPGYTHADPQQLTHELASPVPELPGLAVNPGTQHSRTRSSELDGGSTIRMGSPGGNGRSGVDSSGAPGAGQAQS